MGPPPYFPIASCRGRGGVKGTVQGGLNSLASQGGGEMRGHV